MFCSAVCKFSVYVLILSITFDTEMGIYREEPKERLRLTEVELLENMRPERKVAP